MLGRTFVVLNLLLVLSIIEDGRLALVGLAPTSPLVGGASQLVDSDLHGTGAIALPCSVGAVCHMLGYFCFGGTTQTHAS